MQLADQPGLKVNAGVDLHIENGILTYLHSAHANMPHLKQIADSFGPPEYIEAVLAIGPDSGYYIPEAYYPKLGLAFKISPNRNDTGYIKQNMEIRSIEYFAPGDLLSYLPTKYSCGSDEEHAAIHAQTEISKYVRPWPGFGRVTVIPSR